MPTAEKKNGRPSVWTPELEESIVERMLTRSLRRICAEDKDVPDRITIQRHILKNEAFATKCARARAQHALHRLEEIEDDLDTITPENAKAVQVKVGFAQWLAERLLSKEYGNRTEHNVELGIKVIALPGASEPIRERPLLKPAFDEKLLEGE